jgi:hypothetical protein
MTSKLPVGTQPPTDAPRPAAPARPRRPKRPPRPAPPRPRWAPRADGTAPCVDGTAPDAGGTAPCAGGTAHDAGSTAPDAGVPRPRVRVGSPAHLLAVVPGLLGFEPGQSIVVVGTESPGAAVRLTLRYDVPDPRRPEAAAALAAHAAGVLAAQRVTTAVAVGYGTDAAVAPVANALRDRAAEAGISLTEVLRAENGRYWS